MSILRKKLQVKASTPSALETLPEYFTEMYEQLASYLEATIGQEVALAQTMQGPKFFGSDVFDTYKSDITGLLFAVGDHQGSDTHSECQILLEVSLELVQAIVAAKLGGIIEKNLKFKLFDILIVQPLAELVLHKLKNMGGAAEDDILVDRSLTVDDFKFVKFNKQEQWLKLDFPINLIDKLQQKSTQVTSKTKSAKNRYDNNDLQLTLYISQSKAKSIVQFGQEKHNLRIIDPDSPWTQHMRTTLLAAKRPLEIVIEDLKLSIADCTRLELGQIIPLPGASHERLNIKTTSNNRKIILTTATLGAFKSSKAVKLNADIDPDFMGDLSFCN